MVFSHKGFIEIFCKLWLCKQVNRLSRNIDSSDILKLSFILSVAKLIKYINSCSIYLIFQLIF